MCSASRTSLKTTDLEKCALSVCVWSVELNSSSLQDTWRRWCAHLLLKYSLISAHTDKSNTSFKSVKTVYLCALTVTTTHCAFVK